MKFEQEDNVLALIVRNLAGIADSDEVTLLNDWIDRSQRNREYFDQVRNIWDASERTIDIENIDPSMAYEKVLRRIPALSKKRNLWYYWQKAASIVIIPLIIGALLWMYIIKTNSPPESDYDNVVYNEVFTPIGTRSSLFLADSSVVWLNSGSSIRYPVKFNATDRTVYLKGEAYFEVKSDKSKPFKVRTTSLEVRATGTKFGVSEYDSTPATEVTLVSGKVTVKESGENDPQSVKELVPDEHLVYNRDTGENISSFGDTYRYISWKDGILIFRNEPFDSVLGKISQYFNVDIELRSDELKNYRYYATFKEESLEEILKLLKISAPIDYTEVRRVPLPDGTFPKKKVIITHRK